ncbi:hypothetical protein A3Q24_05760 [Lactobacillus johnsonii]|uniref:Uncharacterized protein n=1 Tax=Lactobacillus johnsonii TaxID=33959 RepID=A0A267M6F6_LACJH|nr:hypothetical protein A3Q24_05760 [Lactobacillus johnsonii]
MLKLLIFLSLFNTTVTPNYSPMGKVEFRDTINTQTLKHETIILTPVQAHQLDKYGEVAFDDMK